HRANAAVSKVIDIIHSADVLAQLEQVPDGGVKVLRLERTVVEIGCFLVLEQLDVELQAAYARKVVFPRIEKHSVEQSSRRVERGRIAGTQLAIDFDQRFLRGLDRVTLQCLADNRTHIVALGEEQIEFNHAGRLKDLRQLVGSQLGVGFEQNFARGGVHHVAGNPGAFKIGDINFDLGDLGFLNFFQNIGVDLTS